MRSQDLVTAQGSFSEAEWESFNDDTLSDWVLSTLDERLHAAKEELKVVGVSIVCANVVWLDGWPAR